MITNTNTNEKLKKEITVKIKVEFEFNELGYVGKPFWPEITTLIDISHDVHPKLGEAKKAEALMAACSKRGITPEEYAAIVERSKRPFYTADGLAGGEIVIPARVIQSFLNNTCQSAPKALEAYKSKGLTFVGVKPSDGNGGRFFRTGKTAADALQFARLVKLEESNQRSMQTDAYLPDFTASGVIELDEEVITEEKLHRLIAYGGKWYGIGSCRPQGYGRFQVTRWDVL